MMSHKKSQPDHCSKAFETILSHSGKFGPYQRRVYALVSAMHIVCTSILTFMKFIPNLELKQNCNEIIESPGNTTYDFVRLNATVAFPVTCYSYYDNDVGLELDWVFPEWSYPEIQWNVRMAIHYAQCAGLAVGCILGSSLSDYLGRRRITYASFLLLCIAQVSSGASQDWVAFLVCRSIVGLGAGSFMLSSLVLVLELVGHDWRDILVCLLPWWLGPSLLSLEALATRHWRYLASVSGVVGMPLLGSYFLVLESPRWLMCNHKFAQAEHTIKEIVACNCRPVPELITWFDISKACILNTMHKKTYTFLDTVTTSCLRKGTFAVIFTWMLGSMVYSGLFRSIRQLTSNPYLNNFLLYNPAVVIIIFTILINKSIGRRWCVFLFAMSSGLVSLCILVLHVTNETSDLTMINLLAFFTNLGVTATLSLISLVTLETYPTVIRTMGLCIGLVSGLTGYVLSDQLIIYLSQFHYTVPFLTYGAMMCILAVGVLGFPETIRKPLPDILRCRHRTLCSHETVRLTPGWRT